jgi:hypothetical protein
VFLFKNELKLINYIIRKDLKIYNTYGDNFPLLKKFLNSFYYKKDLDKSILELSTEYIFKLQSKESLEIYRMINSIEYDFVYTGDNKIKAQQLVDYININFLEKSNIPIKLKLKSLYTRIFL